MKKITLFCAALAIAAGVSAQDVSGKEGLRLDAREDTTNVVTITDIIAVQEQVTSQNSTDAHFGSVWSRSSYFNLGYNTSMTMSPKEDYVAGLTETEMVEPFESDWGLSLTLGHNYRLHKKPIANTLMFNLDFSYINLHVNHFKAVQENEKDKVFDSNLKHEYYDPDERESHNYNYLPWNMDKYEFNYSMELGPSVTLAPFNYVNVKGLHYLKFNIYYHLGYELSMVVIGNNKKLDANTTENANHKEMNSSSKLIWGHGLTSTFGLSFSWKSIGFGWETRKCSPDYQSLQKELFGNFKYKFSDTTNRIYLQIRY